MREYPDDPIERELELQLEWERQTRPPRWLCVAGLVAGVFGLVQFARGVWEALS